MSTTTAFTMFLMLSAGVMAVDSSVPTVTIIGDSISTGYTPDVEKLLDGKFKVQHACGKHVSAHCNNGFSGAISGNLGYYFRNGNADVVTFNSGIHDMSKSLKALRMPCSTATEITPPERYYRNLSKIADYLKNHAKTVIWIDTTTLSSSLCAATHLQQYNSIGEKVAHEHGFYVLRLDSKFHDKSGIHFTEEGYAALGKQVSDCIVAAWVGNQTRECFRN